MTASVNERVSAGFALLDEHKPGWYTRIDLSALDVSSTKNCPLGQTYADDAGLTRENPYLFGVAQLFNGVIFTANTVKYGFASPGYNGFAELTAEWRRQIEARLLKDRVKGEVDAAAEVYLGIGQDEWDCLLPATHLVGLG